MKDEEFFDENTTRVAFLRAPVPEDAAHLQRCQTVAVVHVSRFLKEEGEVIERTGCGCEIRTGADWRYEEATALLGFMEATKSIAT